MDDTVRLITSINWVDVPKDRSFISSVSIPDYCVKCRWPQECHGEFESPLKVREEIVEGRRYSFMNGKEIIIGAGVAARDILMLDYTTQDRLQRENMELSSDLRKLRAELQAVKELKWYQRIFKVFVKYS